MSRCLRIDTVGAVVMGVLVVAGGCEKGREQAAAPKVPVETTPAPSVTAATAPAGTTPADIATPAPTETAPTPVALNALPATPEMKDSTLANVQKLPSGLVIEDLKVGTGEPCPAGATVTIHYRGTLMNGTEFDSSLGGKPVTFPLRSLIQGWQVGIPGMMAGGKRKLTIPYALAYGERGSPPVIPAKADLIFEIELFSFKK